MGIESFVLNSKKGLTILTFLLKRYYKNKAPRSKATGVSCEISPKPFDSAEQTLLHPYPIANAMEKPELQRGSSYPFIPVAEIQSYSGVGE